MEDDDIGHMLGLEYQLAEEFYVLALKCREQRNFTPLIEQLHERAVAIYETMPPQQRVHYDYPMALHLRRGRIKRR